jgi:hypothetical protein
MLASSSGGTNLPTILLFALACLSAVSAAYKIEAIGRRGTSGRDFAGCPSCANAATVSGISASLARYELLYRDSAPPTARAAALVGAYCLRNAWPAIQSKLIPLRHEHL